MIHDLVNQFSDPLAFYRELIQNSLDAKCNRIDVTLDFKPDDGSRGELTIAVEDDGDGMDEQIIDNYLLVVFRSSKEGDFTKIGKFGIGFLSVFAIKPELVRVYTARAGESWRIDFHGDKHYEKYRMSEMREGTRVELVRPFSAEKLQALVGKSYDTIKYWCKYAEAEIYFREMGSSEPARTVREPFDLPGGSSLRYTEEGTEIVMGFSAEAAPLYGFYNRGLTLKEDKKAFFKGVTFRAKSRYLEHTLTRDNVMEDENYQKLMGILERLVRQELPKKLKTELSNLAGQVSAAGMSGNAAALQNLASSWNQRAVSLAEVRNRSRTWLSNQTNAWPILPTLSGTAVCVKDIQAASHPPGPAGQRALYHDGSPNRIVEALAGEKMRVLVSGPWADWIAVELGAEPMQASKTFMLPEIVSGDGLAAAEREFCSTLAAMDRAVSRKYVRIIPARFDDPGTSIADFIFVTQKEKEVGELAYAERDPDTFFDLILSSMLTRERRSALINLSHPFIRRLIRLHATRPGFAGYLCLKVMHLHDGRIPPDKKRAFSNLAEKFETALLELAVQKDAVHA